VAQDEEARVHRLSVVQKPVTAVLSFDPTMSSIELKQLVKQFIVNNVKIEVERLAEEGGHTVLFTPTYHSDLQPIKLVWARVKGNVG
jgi:transposase